MRYRMILIYGDRELHSAAVELTPEELEELYQTLNKLSHFSDFQWANPLGGKDFIQEGVLRDSIVRVVRADLEEGELDASQ